MEFDQLQKIWDSQHSETHYTINGQALHNRILSKLGQTKHIANTSELVLILVNLGAGIFILCYNRPFSVESGYLGLVALWLFASAVYVLISRIRRIRANRQFDRSIEGDLHHAIAIASYQCRLSQIMRWNILPIGGLTLLALEESHKPRWTSLLIISFFILGYLTGIREHRMYKARKRELQTLQHKLQLPD